VPKAPEPLYMAAFVTTSLAATVASGPTPAMAALAPIRKALLPLNCSLPAFAPAVAMDAVIPYCARLMLSWSTACWAVSPLGAAVHIHVSQRFPATVTSKVCLPAPPVR